MTRLVFGSIVVSRVTIRSAVARRLYTLLSGGIPIMTVELLQPVLQLLVQREVIPVAVSTTWRPIRSQIESFGYRSDRKSRLELLFDDRRDHKSSYLSFCLLYGSVWWKQL